MSRMRAWLLWACMGGLLMACSTPHPVPPAILDADVVAQAARRAADQQHWIAAEHHWLDAAARYAALDDWQHAGMASLGAVQADVLQANWAAAEVIVREVCDGPRYPDAVKAEAYYEWALLAMAQHDAVVTAQQLTRAAELAEANAPVRAAIWNAQARLAAARRDWTSVLNWTGQAQKATGADPRELANANRLAGEALLNTWRLPEAKAALLAALVADKGLARPESILSDLRLLAEAARMSNQTDASIWQDRAEAACRALARQDCLLEATDAASQSVPSR